MQNNAVEIKGGDCRERLDRLIHKFKNEDAKACTEKVNINIYEMKVWSSQLWLRFKQSQLSPKNVSGAEQDLNPWPLR